MTMRPLVVRWTIGDVHPLGFEALRLSIWGARRLFGPDATYVACVNSVPLDRARELTGNVPDEVVWRDVTGELPGFLRAHLDENLAEGVGWKFAPLQLDPDRYELALDNDCILWEMPVAIREWLNDDPRGFVIAEDVRVMFGQFQERCGPEPRNSGIRGLPPNFALRPALHSLLNEPPVTLSSELDEQGMQVALVSMEKPPLVVRVDEVTICAPFWPLRPDLGRCGAHFVGLNARQLPWKYYDRPASEWTREHWRTHRPELYRRVGIEPLKRHDRLNRRGEQPDGSDRAGLLSEESATV